jgi:hypothetical protein
LTVEPGDPVSRDVSDPGIQSRRQVIVSRSPDSV